MMAKIDGEQNIWAMILYKTSEFSLNWLNNSNIGIAGPKITTRINNNKNTIPGVAQCIIDGYRDICKYPDCSYIVNWSKYLRDNSDICAISAD